MPLFDFTCTACQHAFEALVRGSSVPACPACGSTALERQVALPAIKTSSTRGQAMAAAKRRDAAQGAERVHAQREYARNHDD
jgi:putative FmdB family regulatory protein